MGIFFQNEGFIPNKSGKLYINCCYFFEKPLLYHEVFFNSGNW